MLYLAHDVILPLIRWIDECPGAVIRPRPGRFISVMASARLPGGLRDTDEDPPRERVCVGRVSPRAMSQSELPRIEKFDLRARPSTLQRCCKQVVYSLGYFRHAGLVPDDPARVLR